MQMRNLAIWALVFVLLLALFQLLQNSSDQTAPSSEVTYSQFLARVERNEISQATIQGDQVRAQTGTGQTIVATLPPCLRRGIGSSAARVEGAAAAAATAAATARARLG